jgi:hypothetical protein
VTDHADLNPHASRNGVPAVELPETDDPVVLRELLRQAREHLRLRESIEQLMTENTTRTEVLLLEARAAQAPGIDPAALAGVAADLKAALASALAAANRLGELATPADASTVASPRSEDVSPSPVVTPDGEPRTVEVIVHEIHAPALARSLQQHLAAIDGVDRAEVRELAEGLLRITVAGAARLDGDTLAGWEPDRPRTIRTARPDVLEIELAPTNP